MFLTELFDTASDTAVLTFMRANPPTLGHKKVIDRVLSIPGYHCIMISHSQDNKKNPLTAEEKIKYLKKMYPGKNVFQASSKESPTIFHAATNLYKQGYTKLIVVVGEDRVAAFDESLNKYNGVFNDAGAGFKFAQIDVVSAGDRDPDADGIEGLSASKMRELALANDVEGFKTGLDPALQNLAPEIIALIQERLATVPKVKKKKVAEIS